MNILKSIIMPNMTTTERNALTASNGMIIYNSTDSQFQRYEAGSWTTFAGGSSGLNYGNVIGIDNLYFLGK